MSVSTSPAAERMRRLRARRAAERSRQRDTSTVDPADLLVPAVRETLTALDLGPEDAAAGLVALRLAQQIDELEDQAYAARRFAPLLLSALARLHATPMSRAMARTTK